MQKRNSELPDLDSWLGLRVGLDDYLRLIKRARGGDNWAVELLEDLCEEFYQDLPGAARMLRSVFSEGPATLDEALEDAKVRRSLEEDGFVSGEVERDPDAPVTLLARLTVQNLCGPPRQGRPPLFGNLREDLKGIHEVLKDLIRSWRKGHVPVVDHEKFEDLKYWLPARVGEQVRHLPPDFFFSPEGQGEDPTPGVFLGPGRDIFWGHLCSAVRLTHASYCIIGELADCTPDQVRSAAGTRTPYPKKEKVLDRFWLKEEGLDLRVLVELPTELPKPEWPWGLPEDAVKQFGRDWVVTMLTPTTPNEIDDVRILAKRLVKLRTEVELTPNEADGVDANLSWDWDHVEALCQESLGFDWRVKQNPGAGVIWLSKKVAD